MKQCDKIDYSLMSDPRITNLLDDMGVGGLGIYLMVRLEIECMGEGKLLLEQVIATFKSRSRRNKIEQVLFKYDLFEIDANCYIHLRTQAPAQTPGHRPEHRSGHRPGQMSAQVVNLNYPENNNININNHYGSSFIDALECENGMYRDSVCMQSTYGDLLKKHWKEAVAQFRQHVIAYDKLNGITSLQEARRYFSSFTKLSVRSGANLRDYLASLEKTENNINQYSTPAPADAPERPSPDHQWSFATNSWVLVH